MIEVDARNLSEELEQTTCRLILAMEREEDYDRLTINHTPWGEYYDVDAVLAKNDVLKPGIARKAPMLKTPAESDLSAFTKNSEQGQRNDVPGVER